MRSQFIRIKGREVPVGGFRFRDANPLHDRRETVTFPVKMGYAEAQELFTSPGAWSAVSRYTDAKEETEEVVTCTDYELLCSVHDHCNGTLSVTMGKATAAELLAVLIGQG